MKQKVTKQIESGTRLQRGDYINDEEAGLLIITKARFDTERFIFIATAVTPTLWQRLGLGMRQRIKRWKERHAEKNLSPHVPPRGEGGADDHRGGRLPSSPAALGEVTTRPGRANIRPAVQDVVPENNREGLQGLRRGDHRR